MADLSYPIGKYEQTGSITAAQREGWIEELASFPNELSDVVIGLSDEQLDTPYRPGGWTVRQVVHHLPDSHLNSYQRFRLALTEDAPTIKPYAEDRWAELIDAKTAPIEVSLSLLDPLHRRWVMLLRSLDDAAFARTFHHPESGEKKLDWVLGSYAWHGRHHLTQITGLIDRMEWRP